MVKDQNNNKDKRKEDKKKINPILKVLLIGYILILCLGLSLMYIGSHEGVNKLYKHIDDNCYNNVELKEQNDFKINEKYLVFFNDYHLGKYNCTVILESEFKESLNNNKNGE